MRTCSHASITFGLRAAIGASAIAVVTLSGCGRWPVDETSLGDPGAYEQAAAPVSTQTDANPSAATEEILATIPDVPAPTLELSDALALVAMPLSCLDRPHAPPRDRVAYLDDITATRRPGFERERAFYGCWDWHSAVNSTWALVKILKEFPNLPVTGLVREKLEDHLSERALAGEVEFFEGNRSFERPYGWAWLIRLYAELRTWDLPDAAAWADRVEPLAALFSARMVEYLPDLERPSRTGTHGNTAFALGMMLDAARTVGDGALEEAIVAASRRLYLEDSGCPVAYEPWGADFLSPCLEEAGLMAMVLEPVEYVGWLDGFMPDPGTKSFEPLMTPVEVAGSEAGQEAEGTEAVRANGKEEAEEEADTVERTEGEETESGGDSDSGETNADKAASPEPGGARSDEAEQDPDAEAEILRALGSKSHLIGLALIRAEAMLDIAAGLPPEDPRIPVYRQLARLHGRVGIDAMFDAGYAGSHWIGTFALEYLLAARAQRGS